MVGVFAAWISVNYPRAWYGSRWFVGALGVVILFVTYASLWRITDHHLEWSADSYFARTFRFNLVSLGFAMLLPRRFFLASGARNLRLDRSSAHCSLVIRSLSRSLPVFPGGGEVHASEVNQFIRSKHGSYVFAIRRCYRDQCAAISPL
jgi:hypothetical protein